MNDNDTIAAILKAGKDILVLVAGVDNTVFCQARTGAVRTQRIDVNLSRNRIVIRLSVRGKHWMVVAAWWAQQHNNHQLFLLQRVRFSLAKKCFN